MIYVDFETRSGVDLKKVGLYVYARHPTTEIFCTGWAVDDLPARCEPGFPDEVQELLWYSDTIVAHNAAFEREVSAARGPVRPPDRWVDTAAVAAAMSLPRKLEALAKALHLDIEKDMAGHRTLLKLTRPRNGWGQDDPDFWEEEDRPGDFTQVREYCRMDVEVMRAALKKMAPLPPQEARLWALTERMNQRGVRADIASLAPAQALLAADGAAGAARFKALVGHGLKSYARAAPALGLPDLRKPTVRRALKTGVIRSSTTPPGYSFPVVTETPVTPRVREALQIFTRLARSSPAKLEAMRLRANHDGRLRGMLVYAGAERTGRWSGSGVQPQNFPRGLGEGTDTFFDALHAGVTELVYENPTGTVAEALRGFFLGPMTVGDYSQIEARMLAWFAGQADLLKVFAEKGDPYKVMAARIYGKDPKVINKDERFMGKQAVLGCGYGMGDEKFRGMLADIYDVDIPVDLAVRVVNTYRTVNNRIPAFWRKVEDAFRHVLVTKSKGFWVQEGRLGMGTTTIGGIPYAFIQLPSKRRLYYCEPELSPDGIRYWGRNIYTGGKWERVGTWGGKITENIVQAASRDVMADAMLRMDEAGIPLVLTVHDEIVAEGLHLDSFKTMMGQIPAWAKGLPLDAEVFTTERYRK